MNAYTKQEATAINDAWQAIRDLCSCTNWSDGPAWREAEKLERRQVGDSASPVTVAARAMICKAWAEGAANPDRPARNLYWIRPGYLSAFLLGVRHAVEQAGTDYNGPKVAEALRLCEAAIAANDAHTRRIVEGV